MVDVQIRRHMQRKLSQTTSVDVALRTGSKGTESLDDDDPPKKKEDDESLLWVSWTVAFVVVLLGPRAVLLGSDRIIS